MYYINTLKRELVDTNAYKLQSSLSERVIVDGHGCHTALHFGVKAKENQDKVPTLYWLPKLHKKPYKARFIANSSSCTTTELSKLLTSCLTAVKKHVIKYCEKVYERSGKNLFWSIKNLGEILDKLKDKDYCPIEIIKGLTDKGRFQYLTKLMGPQEGTYLYATQFHSLR